MFRKKLSHFFQSGRSMIEILGVLAVVGLLSIGGLTAYRLGMRRYWASKILNDVKQYHVVIEGMNTPFNLRGEINDNDFTPETDYEFLAESAVTGETDYYRITTYGISKPLCETMVQMAGKNPFENYTDTAAFGASKVAVRAYEDGDFEWSTGENLEICEDGEQGNEVLFFFGDISGLCRSECRDDEKCYYGNCCLTKHQCNGDCCEEGEVCCKGACHPADCGTDANGIHLEMNENCGCQCPVNAGFKPAMEGGQCVCNSDPAYGFTQVGSQCVCGAGKVNVEGKCKTFGCYTSNNRNGTLCTTQYTCHCFLDDKRCGYYCIGTDMSLCRYGYCVDKCLGNRWEYNEGTKEYGCRTANGLFSCEKFDTNLSCVEVGKAFDHFGCKNCTDATGTTCAYGDCFDVCSTRTYHGVNGEFGRVGGLWGCIYRYKDLDDKDVDVSCFKQNNRYYCFKNGNMCAHNCLNPFPDGSCSQNTCGDDECPEGTIAGEDGRCTRADGVYCKLGWDNSGYWCYLPSNNELCGKTCNKDGTNCTLGCCDGGTGSVCCPAGYEYKRLAGGVYGCYKSDTKIGCYNFLKTSASSTPYVCEVNGTRCADYCSDLGAENCNRGICKASKCPTGTTFQQIATNYYGCYNNALNIGCYQAAVNNQYCYIDSAVCGTGCGPNYDGKKANGDVCVYNTATYSMSCQTSFACPSTNQRLVNESTKGCINPNNVACFTNGTCYANYGAYINSYRCGTGCNTTTLDGTGCTSGVCDPDACNEKSWVYNATTQLYECKDNGSITCVNGVCKLGGQQCGVECTKGESGDKCNDGTVTCTQANVNCAIGVCSTAPCPEGSSVRKATDDFFGCYNNGKNVTCYPNGTIKCVQNGRIVGSDCNMDGTNCTCEAGTGKAVVEVGGGTTDATGFCTFCPKGTCSSANGQSCGGAVNKVQVCMKCPKGYYIQYAGWASCSINSVGYYTIGTGNISQTQCPAGKTTPTTGYYQGTSEECQANVKACGCQTSTNACYQNSDCASGEFCWFSNVTNCYSPGDGKCRPLTDFAKQTDTMEDGKTWTRSRTSMNWWSVQNWCKGYGLKAATRADLGCSNILPGTFCTQSPTAEAVRKKWSNVGWHYLEDYGNSCSAFYFYLTPDWPKYINGTSRLYSGYALCH